MKSIISGSLRAIAGVASVLVVSFGMTGSALGGTVTHGDIQYSSGSFLAGETIPLGVDPYGYNYQAHMFSGSYYNSYADGAGYESYSGSDEDYLLANPGADGFWAWPYRDVQLAMKWNDAWLSNKDLDGDGALDRHYGLDSYIGSGAWITNHMSGTDVVDGKEIRWNYFVKIVAAPADAVRVPTPTADDPNAATWYDAKGNEIGPDIWGQFIILEEVTNDPSAGAHGVTFKTMLAPGFGKY